jgi:hypothetical protein
MKDLRTDPEVDLPDGLQPLGQEKVRDHECVRLSGWSYRGDGAILWVSVADFSLRQILKRRVISAEEILLARADLDEQYIAQGMSPERRESLVRDILDLQEGRDDRRDLKLTTYQAVSFDVQIPDEEFACANA